MINQLMNNNDKLSQPAQKRVEVAYKDVTFNQKEESNDLGEVKVAEKQS